MLDSIEKKKYRRFKVLSAVVLFLIVLDYVLTYIGIVELGVIAEANPFMVWMFNLPFIAGLLIRLIMAATMFLLFLTIYKNGHRLRFPLVIFALAANMFILFLHIRWIAYIYT